MNRPTDIKSSGVRSVDVAHIAGDREFLHGRLLELAAAGIVTRDGIVMSLDAVRIIHALTFSGETGSMDELVFEQASWITTQQAADRTGCSPQWIRHLARTGAITARRAADRWLIRADGLGRQIRRNGD